MFLTQNTPQHISHPINKTFRTTLNIFFNQFYEIKNRIFTNKFDYEGKSTYHMDNALNKRYDIENILVGKFYN